MEGDSTMWGLTFVNGTYGQAPNNQPFTVGWDLRDNAVTVVNAGVPGSTVTEAVLGTAPYTVSLAERLQKSPAQIVVGNYAINDAAQETPDFYRNSLNNWITIVRAAGKLPVLEEPNPICWNPATAPPGTEPVLDVMVDVLRDVAKKQGVALIAQYDYIKTLDWHSMLTDCAHPDDSLYKIMGDRAAQQLAPIIRFYPVNFGVKQIGRRLSGPRDAGSLSISFQFSSSAHQSL
jgi:lysophospholipase L1-like esterase